ncbi:MAG: insulinase family protein [Chlamydiales bacterium]|nr:insulinase family protein [Chlamydiales bacterium]
MRNRFLTTLLTLVCLFSQAIAVESSYEIIKDEATVPILTPSFANRKTAKIRLSNGLEAYIISDPRAEKSAAAMVVKTGSWEDPDDAPGMAHFVEHMLFLGTTKYPEESAFDRYVTQNGGTTNAATYPDHTNYMFSVETDSFPEALDRFASFFREPLFNPSGVEREINAIDQEYARMVRDDDWRWMWVTTTLANKKHPGSRFTAGNKQTLSKVQREELLKWYDEHYSANLMRVVIYSSLDIDKLKNFVVEDFSQIKNLNRKPYVTNEPLFGPTQRGAMTLMASLKDAKTLYLSWEMPARFANMKDTKPDQIVCHILGHEGEHSLLSVLKEHNLAESLACGGYKKGANNFITYIRVGLTKKGLKDVDSVIETVFQGIDRVREHPVPPYIFDEVQKVALTHYQYQEPKDAFSVVSLVADGLSEEDLATYPEKTYLIKKFDPKAVSDFLSFLTPQNVYISLLAQPIQLKTDLDTREPWGGTAFTTRAIPVENIEKWKNLEVNTKVDLPSKNPYLPDHLQVLTREDPRATAMPKPKLLIDNAFQKLYYAQDNYYRVPEVFCYFNILTPEANQGDPKKAALMDLYVKTAEDIMKRTLYPAEMAGLYFQLAPDTYGIQLQLYGYDEHAAQLLKEVIDGLKNLHPTPEQFAQYREVLLQSYHNIDAEPPLTRTAETLAAVIRKDYSTYRQKLQAMPRINYDQFLTFIKTLYRENYVEGIIYGDLTEDQAKGMAGVLRDGLGGEEYPAKERPAVEIADLTTQSSPQYLTERSKTSGNAVVLLLESGPYSPQLHAVQNVLSQGMNAPFFSTLRTKQQTGYVVGNWDQEVERRLFQVLAVESDTHDGRDLLARFELFLEDFNRTLGISELTEPEFTSIQAALASKLEQPAQNLKAMGQLLGTLATDYKGDFDWIKKRIEAIRQLKYSDFLEQSHKILSSRNKKRLAVVTRGSMASEGYLEYVPTKSLKEMRNNLDYEPANHVIKDKPKQH